MKKTYINPEMEIFKLAISQPVLDASVTTLGGEAKAGTTGMGHANDGDDW